MDNRGRYGKYNVYRAADTDALDPDSYFVLRPERDPAARVALAAYAAACEDANPWLARDLRLWLTSLRQDRARLPGVPR